MPITLLDYALDIHRLAVNVEFLSVLCSARSVPAQYQCNVLGSHVLNLTINELGSVALRGKSLVEMLMPFCLAFGGRNERNNRADLAVGEKGLNFVFTSVMKRVIILAARAGFRELARDLFALA